VTAFTIIEDDTSFVVKSPKGDLYPLPQDKFKNNWETNGSELDNNCGFRDWETLKKAGFKLHYPKKNMLRYMYQIKRKDIIWFPTGSFWPKWPGAQKPQPVKEHDYLVLPESCDEIYMMPEEIKSCCYAEATS